MTHTNSLANGTLGLLSHLHLDQRDSILHIQLARPEKRNALNMDVIAQLHTAFANLPEEVKVVVLSGQGDHFCAGLDLSSIHESTVADGIARSRRWHACFDQIQYATVPVVTALQGAVIGGGLELASSTHVRVADRSAYYGLPEGQRGIFVGGGGSSRVPRLIGVARMADMMLTGHVLDAHEGYQFGLSTYLVDNGHALSKAFELAEKIASNAPLSNFAIVQALPRIADMAQPNGLFVESLMASIAQGDGAAKARVRAFFDGKANKVVKQDTSTQ